MGLRRKLLLVDDDEAVIAFLRAKLGAEFDLTATTSAEQVLELARKHRPDLVLCDIELPGMDGGDVSAALFSDGGLRDIPVVFLTALVSPEALRASGNQLAGRAAISKQSPIDEIIARLRAIVD